MSIIEFLDVIAARIEHFETGRIIYEEIDNKVQDYLSEFKKKQVIEAKLHLNEVRLELEKDWNTYRDLVKKPDNQGLASTSTTVEEGESSRTKPTIGTLTPKKKVIFKKTTPKSKLMEKLLCSIHLGEFPIGSYLKVKDSTKSLVTFLVLVRGNFFLYHLKAYLYSFILSSGF